MGVADLEAKALQRYFREGEARALSLGNRGAIHFTDDGKLDPAIVQAYARCGFYVFEGVLSPGELTALRDDFLDMQDRLPSAPDSKVDHKGRPALGALEGDTFVAMWSKPLGDPFGGTDFLGGRHQVKMYEPAASEDLPQQVPLSINRPVQYSEATLRLLAHPRLLAVVEALNGEDFVPLADAIIIKNPGEGASFSWHQDGVVEDPQAAGFQVMVQLYGSTAANGVWYLPNSHNLGRIDLAAMSHEVGSDRLPGAVPIICKPGDVAISNRQVAHGSFANTSPDARVTINLGFFRFQALEQARGERRSGAQGANSPEAIRKRCELVGYAIDARRRHFPDETPFVYKPHARSGRVFRWGEDGRHCVRQLQKVEIALP